MTLKKVIFGTFSKFVKMKKYIEILKIFENTPYFLIVKLYADSISLKLFCPRTKSRGCSFGGYFFKNITTFSIAEITFFKDWPTTGTAV